MRIKVRKDTVLVIRDLDRDEAVQLAVWLKVNKAIVLDHQTKRAFNNVEDEYIVIQVEDELTRTEFMIAFG